MLTPNGAPSSPHVFTQLAKWPVRGLIQAAVKPVCLFDLFAAEKEKLIQFSRTLNSGEETRNTGLRTLLCPVEKASSIVNISENP